MIRAAVTKGESAMSAKGKSTTGTSEAPTADRRGFMKMIGIGGVGSGVAAIAGTAPVAAESKAPAQTDAVYRETEHVRTYYDLARG
jgi:hypothetical protein